MTSRPATITGGCLCNSIRYAIHFPPEVKWPPESATCQCTMCRKWTSSLCAQFLVLLPSQLTPFPYTFHSHFPTYTEFQSSSNRFRGFCSKCGSSLIWRSQDNPKTLDLFLGTVDQKWLVEEKEVGKALATPNQYQIWCENAVKDVTDLVKTGRRFLREDDEGTKGELID
ncbi:uncharacterized protein BDR25DRAFT_288853 [Lindgomyces ingoldianus]|uniref:Uncharacterized protein n=1 Tax=Lindgomyces ingoldianus TaxID=673940 RepID=A0ACB6QR46_9PLEO|nr:uncharacterized protein BDR25DRAFT_288853 [Lindgomyces ingoldianus]KAF2469337.1 hypothetical protein BDR25DRAFT_288853 [Lindgomyces ingoldianus]